MKDYLDIILGCIALVGAIYRLAQVEAHINARIARMESAINTAVDNLKDSLVERLNNTENKLNIHLVEYNEKKLFTEYRLNATDESVKHKFNRLAGLIKQVSGFLHRESGFQIRDDQY
jgi:uncharacterized protein YicC (UPF0701 family)